MMIFLYFILFVSLQHQFCAYRDDLNLKFSEIVLTNPLGEHFRNLTVYHPLYDEIARGTLPLENFKTLVQQDDLYIRNFLNMFRILEERETDLDRKNILHKYGSENWDEHFQQFYTKFNFTPADYMIPSTLEYVETELMAAKHDEIAVAVASAYPCYTVWSKMGSYLHETADLVNYPNHLYKEFIKAQTPSEYSNREFIEFTEFVNGYYERLGDSSEMKYKMIDAYVRSVEREFHFATGIYQHKTDTILSPTTTD